MSLVYVFAASPMEGQPVRKLAERADSESPLRCGDNDVVLTVTGMGPKNARSKAEAALGKAHGTAARTPDAILVIGLCGGLSASLSERQIVAYSDCRSTDPCDPVLACSPALTDAILRRLEASTIPCERVRGLTSARIATTRSERLALADSGATVVDMESYPILKAAAAAGIPAAVLRVVADSVDRELPDFNRALDDQGGLDGRKALKVALGSPLRTARLLGANKRAIEQLGKALEAVVPFPFA
jgi:nucleoside phosphorylase